MSFIALRTDWLMADFSMNEAYIVVMTPAHSDDARDAVNMRLKENLRMTGHTALTGNIENLLPKDIFMISIPAD